MIDRQAQARRRAVDAIADYIAGHPAAADNEQGIAHWWLKPMGVDVPIEQVRQALMELEQRGIVSRVILPDGRAFYRAARSP